MPLPTASDILVNKLTNLWRTRKAEELNGKVEYL